MFAAPRRQPQQNRRSRTDLAAWRRARLRLKAKPISHIPAARLSQLDQHVLQRIVAVRHDRVLGDIAAHFPSGGREAKALERAAEALLFA